MPDIRLPGGSAVPLRFVGGSKLEVLDAGHFDLVLINILAPVIIAVARDLAARLAASGSLIVAGLIESQEADVAQAFQLQGLEVTERTQEKDWVALVARGR